MARHTVTTYVSDWTGEDISENEEAYSVTVRNADADSDDGKRYHFDISEKDWNAMQETINANADKGAEIRESVAPGRKSKTK